MDKGSSIRRWICVSREREKMCGSDSTTCSMIERHSGTDLTAIAYARVAINRPIWFLDESEREKKKEASKNFSSSHHSAMDLAIYDLPAPGAPYSHKTEDFSMFLRDIQSLILSSTATGVFG